MRAPSHASVTESPIPEQRTLIEQVVDRENMTQEYNHVMRNKGAAGIDKMSVDELLSYLNVHWSRIKEELLNGTYTPSAVLEVEIPKLNGGTRKLGIPTVLDRLIQQALHQKLSRIFDPDFSKHSYGFRSGKSTHRAVKQAKQYQQSGHRRVVDMDLANFFDEVNNDRLISRLRHKVNDSRILRLIRSFLKSGIMVGGLVITRIKGTPQGSPLSPLLSNIVLDELDKELECRGHRFCRYADDCNIYVKSRKAGERVLESISKFIETKLKLKVNQQKSAVSRPWQRIFLGFSFTADRNARLRVPPKSIKRIKRVLKAEFRKGKGRNISRFITENLNPIIRGWINYFGKAEVKLYAEDLDSWIRRHLRQMKWQQWKRPKTRYRELLKLGLGEARARKSVWNGRGKWWNSGASHMNAVMRKKYFDKIGLVSMLDTVLKLRTH